MESSRERGAPLGGARTGRPQDVARDAIEEAAVARLVALLGREALRDDRIGGRGRERAQVLRHAGLADDEAGEQRLQRRPPVVGHRGHASASGRRSTSASSHWARRASSRKCSGSAITLCRT